MLIEADLIRPAAVVGLAVAGERDETRVVKVAVRAKLLGHLVAVQSRQTKVHFSDALKKVMTDRGRNAMEAIAPRSPDGGPH